MTRLSLSYNVDVGYRRGLGMLIAGLLVCALMVWTSAIAWAAPPADPGRVHVVQAGETLADIAIQYGSSVVAIARANGIDDPEVIWVGQQLEIPTGAPEPGAATASLGTLDRANGIYIVQPGDTLATIASRLGVSVDALVEANMLPSSDIVTPGQGIAVPGFEPPVYRQEEASPAAPTTYIVQPGDTLAVIAMRLGTTVRALAQVNGLKNPSLIYAGQRLQIPANIRLPGVPVAGSKRVEVDVSDQRVYVWKGSQLVYKFVVSTGIPGYNTRRGTFRILDKIPMAHSTSLGLAMPYWLGIYWAGSTENGFHALPISHRTGKTLWAGYLGRPISYGCIVLNTSDAALLFNFVDIGTRVDIHD